MRRKMTATDACTSLGCWAWRTFYGIQAMCLLRRCARRLSHRIQDTMRRCWRWTRRLRYWIQIMMRRPIRIIQFRGIFENARSTYMTNTHNRSENERMREEETPCTLLAFVQLEKRVNQNEVRSKQRSCLQCSNHPTRIWRSSWTLTWHKRVPKRRKD